MKPQTVRAIIRFVIRMVADVQVSGVENLPLSGPCIVVSNHLGRLDAPLAYCYTDRDDVTMMVAEKYKNNPLFRFFVKELNAIWVDRFNADLGAMRITLHRLKAGGMIVIAPEGTRSKTGALIEAKPGSSYLAAKAGVPIIPVAITGSEDTAVLSRFKRFQRAKIIAHTGKPFTLPPLKGKNREEELKHATDEIMCQIAAMLPPAYRGVYADHPRLKALLTEIRP
jgi:1-acyl-sn-glycerol-3-phosphate acyltransferase